jgi:hypothetical protein
MFCDTVLRMSSMHLDTSGCSSQSKLNNRWANVSRHTDTARLQKVQGTVRVHRTG